jgi:intracellular sulfur oxidation DsrE/DsrF family protein
MKRFQLYLLSVLLLLPASFSTHAAEYTLARLLALPHAPDGVVIEIVTNDPAGLSWALPRAQEAVKQLHQRFARLPIAIVTHGREQFALTRKGLQKNRKTHELVQQLQHDDAVEVHVCGTYAEMNHVSPEDFPDYVDVAAEGPAQINDYRKLGFLLLTIDAR